MTPQDEMQHLLIPGADIAAADVSRTQSTIGGGTPVNLQTDHDSLIKLFGPEAVEHIMQGRPYLLLLPHDELSEHTARYYAALRGRKFTKIRELVANAIVAAGKMAFHPEKDPAHAISVQQVADRLYLWRKEHRPPAPTNARDVDLGELPIPPLSVTEADPAS